MLEDPWRENIEQTGDVWHEGQNTDLRFIEPVLKQEARIKKTARKLTDETGHDAGHEHREAASAAVIFDIVKITDGERLQADFDLGQRAVHSLILSSPKGVESVTEKYPVTRILVDNGRKVKGF